MVVFDGTTGGLVQHLLLPRLKLGRVNSPFQGRRAEEHEPYAGAEESHGREVEGHALRVLGELGVLAFDDRRGTGN